MNEVNKYVAITIGPIMDTMGIVTKPGALWLSSYMFSYITKRLCIGIGEVVGVEKIITPYIPSKEKADEIETYMSLMEREDGVGLFHDHIIFKDEEGKGWAALKRIISGTIVNLERLLGVTENALSDYIMIKACNFNPENKNPILYCANMLDCLELPKVFKSQEQKHPLKERLKNENVLEIAKSFLGEAATNPEKWSLTRKVVIETKDGAHETKVMVKDIDHIASTVSSKGYKRNNYYCLLRADGDNVSKIISNLAVGPDETIDSVCRQFSKTCLDYCGKVAELVKEYGGVTIYAGGDDLLAMVPCEISGKTVFDLIEEIDKVFEEKFNTYLKLIESKNKSLTEKEKIPLPSLSFGALICHKKYPLYEAVGKSAELLFDVAKKKNNEKKDSIALQLQKHSGQSELLLISKASMKQLAKTLREVLSNDSKDKTDSDAFLLSAAHKLELFKALFQVVGEDEDKATNLFENLFDSSYHKRDESRKAFLHKTLPQIYVKHCLSGGVISFDKSGQVNSGIEAFAHVLRVVKFFVEKGVE